MSLAQIQNYSGHVRSDSHELHNSVHAYNQGCRCDACKEACAAYKHQLRESKRVHKRVCEACGKQFLAVLPTAKLCSRGCKDAMRRELPVDRVRPERSWADLAACLGLADIMFDESRVREAKRICAQCPARDECREEAIANVELGVWGGTTRMDRKRIRLSRRAAAR